MIGHIFSLLTLVIIINHLQNKSDAFSEKNIVIRKALIFLSSLFSIFYFVVGVLSINQGFSIVILFKMEYGLFFIYMTYKLYALNRAGGYCINPEFLKNEEDTIERLIKNTLICLEDEDFEKALWLIDKVERLYDVDQNVVLLKMLINKSLTKEEVDYSHPFAFN